MGPCEVGEDQEVHQNPSLRSLALSRASTERKWSLYCCLIFALISFGHSWPLLSDHEIAPRFAFASMCTVLGAAVGLYVGRLLGALQHTGPHRKNIVVLILVGIASGTPIFCLVFSIDRPQTKLVACIFFAGYVFFMSLIGYLYDETEHLKAAKREQEIIEQARIEKILEEMCPPPPIDDRDTLDEEEKSKRRDYAFLTGFGLSGQLED